MLSFARRSILKELSLVVCALVVLPPLAWAQRAVVPAAHPPVAPVHVSPPSVFHAPVIQTPIMHAPVMYAPIATPPRHPIFLPAVTSSLATVHPPMRPIRPVPPSVLVYLPPFALGGPFWRFNLCWWTNCDLFFPLDICLHHGFFPGPETKSKASREHRT